MKATRIIKSEIGTHGAVEVVWSDEIAFFFNAANLAGHPEIVSSIFMTRKEEARRIIVSRTSAEATISGCKVNS